MLKYELIMARSDTEECYEDPCYAENMTLELDDSVLDKSNDTTIHSGHFMVSCVHDDSELEESSSPKPAEIPPPIAYDFATAVQETFNSYNFGPKSTHHLAIEASLTKLFDCLTLAYSGKLTSPKWKNFKGVKVPLKDKIRLNNIIWREWHMQYIQGHHPLICQFEPPISDKTHTKPEAVVLEGKYWKRRLESVTAEYMKWRMFYKERLSRQQDGLHERELLERVAHTQNTRVHTPTQPMHSVLADQLMQDDDMMDFSFSDTIFSTFNHPFAFPNPKEISQLSNISNPDIIQPGLIQLQPSFDDFMDFDTLPLTDSIMTLKNANAYTNALNLSTHSPVPSVTKESRQMNQLQSLLSQDTSSVMMDTSDTSSLPAILEVPMSSQSRLVTGPSILQQLMAAGNIVTTANNTYHQQQTTSVSVQPSVLPSVLGLPTRVETVAAAPTVQNLQNVQVADPQQVLNMLLSLQKQQQQQQTILPQQQVLTFPSNVALVVQGKDSQQPLSFISPAVQPAHPQPISATTVNFSHLGTLQNQTTVNQALPTNSMFVSAAPQPQRIPSNVPTIYPKLTHHASESVLQKTESEEMSRRASTGSLNKVATEPYKHSNKGSGNRKHFAVPQKSTRVPVSRHRNIAPATQQPEAQPVAKKPAQPSQLASKNTFLAQLLTQADEPGETNKWTNEKAYSAVFQPIKPAATVTVATTSTPTTTTTSLPFSKNFMGSSFTDFQKTVFLGAASQALGTKMTDAIKDQVLTAVSTHGTLSGADSPLFHASSPGSDSGTPFKMVRQKSDVDKQHYIEQRKVSHLTAEQKRRGNIKVCFETLTQIIPTVNQNAKISKAVTLQKGSEYCRKLKQDRQTMKSEAEILKQEIEGLNAAISRCQSQLPATGVPVTRQRADKMREMFDEYVRNRTLVNWKFFIFSIIIRPLFESYSNQVSTADMDQLCRTVLAWLEQHCSLVELRPGVLNSLKQLCTSTSILSDPSKVPEQATQAVNNIPQ